MFNVLLVDDDPAVCTVIQTILERLGHTAQVAKDGREAKDLFAANPGHFDIVITDHRMPRMTGLELVHYLREHEFHGKIIVISGFLTSELEVAYMEKSIDKIIQKPFTTSGLTFVLKNLFNVWKQNPSEK